MSPCPVNSAIGIVSLGTATPQTGSEAPSRACGLCLKSSAKVASGLDFSHKMWAEEIMTPHLSAFSGLTRKVNSIPSSAPSFR